MSKMPKETLLKSLTQPSVMLSNVEQRLSGQAAAAVSFAAADPVNLTWEGVQEQASQWPTYTTLEASRRLSSRTLSSAAAILCW